MEFLDARRLTGPSLLFNGPAAVLDVACTPEEADGIALVWRTQVERMLTALGWAAAEYNRVSLSGGLSLAFTAPIDALYAASEINEWAWAVCNAESLGTETIDFELALAAIQRTQDEEANAALLALQADAANRETTFLWDDDQASLGLGRNSETWPCRELPLSPQWKSFTDIPLGLVTGTNGKTTSVRLATHVLRGANLNVGLSSTDWIAVNDRIIERGDWSGPGGARAVLRQKEVDVAILETARGGLLRRGLGVERADAALITNIAEDHLGDFGSATIDELLDIKWIVSRAVRNDGCLILNADDSRLVKKSADYDGKLVWFSLCAENSVVAAHVHTGGLAFVLVEGVIAKIENGATESICRAQDVPITLGGAARHNIANALAAAALTTILGASVENIRRGLTSMSQDENPGRCNIFDVNDRKVLVDFAHNPHAMHALFDMAEALPANRRVLCFGQAGDRPDELIRQLARDAWAIGLDRVIVSELGQYYRGRDAGEVFALIRDELIACGARHEQIAHYDEESDSLAAALQWASPGDLVIMLALGGSESIHSQLKAIATDNDS